MSVMIYPGEDKIIDFLKGVKSADLSSLSERCNLNIDSVRRAAQSLKAKALVEISKDTKTKEELSEEFKSYKSSKELPEYSVYKKSLEGIAVSKLSGNERSIGLQWALKKGWISIENGVLSAKTEEKKVKEQVNILLSYPENSPEEVRNELLRRKLLIILEDSRTIIKITQKGLTSDLKEEKSSFALNVETNDAPVGKIHPLIRAMMRVKEIFVEMGFEEMDGEFVESTFWNFDALFQPQDHPARELADTFYVDKFFSLPDKKLVKRVKKSHENGWKYKWEEKEAKRGILRTHTTNLSARHIANLNEPKKYFSVSRVFRNEEMDFKHLAEFYQVEGIIAWKNSTFRDLLGVLREFYRKLGFDKIRFRPSYFPYTEPSLEIEVYYKPKEEWMELGGAGIFRPEVTKPLTDIYPVLAWGLSLERPLMLNLELKDIRTFYKNDLDWLKSSRVGE